ncbi:HNH endonuclease [Nocardia gipuzkoensis]|uniref:HNH endonuclease n=1 Tax=Nocardia gipuzkoensis TaxID=2749991 RepID=UPI001E54F950|nr:HNH endonuclease [Nocardia gipuzkoensis]UGT65279.1 HNH endonuclease [Nocardia gipuzkoensis]
MSVNPRFQDVVRQSWPKSGPRPKQRRDTRPREDVLDLVRARCKGRCERCAQPLTGIHGGDPHHRKPRGAGGTRDPRINLPSNIVALCRPCHDWIESQRTAALKDGWLVPRRANPARKEIRSRLHGVVLLSDDGRVEPIGGES